MQARCCQLRDNDFNALTKKAMQLSIAIKANNVTDALCLKKRTPAEALEVFKKMSEEGCSPNAVT